MKVYPLGGNPDSTVFVDAYDKPFDSTIPYDATFFDLLDRFVQAEPWLTRDKVMIDTLKTIGIEKGKPFKPDPKTKSILDKAVREAHEVIALRYETGFVPPFFEGTHWAVPIPKETRDGLGSMFADPNEYGVDGRAVMYHMAYFSPKIFGGGQFYLLNIVDRAGKPLEGNKTYRLTVPPHAPVEQVLVGDGLRPLDARAHKKHVPPEPSVERHGGTEESGRIDGHLLRPDSAGCKESVTKSREPGSAFPRASYSSPIGHTLLRDRAASYASSSSSSSSSFSSWSLVLAPAFPEDDEEKEGRRRKVWPSC